MPFLWKRGEAHTKYPAMQFLNGQIKTMLRQRHVIFCSKYLCQIFQLTLQQCFSMCFSYAMLFL